MGTRSLTTIVEEETPLVTIYRQMDGYPTGHGQDVKAILADGKATIVNGYGMDMAAPACFNGMGCLAAYLIGALKKGQIGGIYLVPPGSNDHGEEYRYTIWADGEGKPVCIKIEHGYGAGPWKVLFSGLLAAAAMDQIEKADQAEESA